MSENYTNIHYWFFGDGSFSHLYALSENRKGKLKVSKEFNIKNPSRLLDYIKVNRIDTVNDTPESGFRNSHLSYIIVEYFNLNDTLISYHLRADSYIKKHGFMDDFGMTPETDSAYKERMNHPKYLLGLKIIGELKMSVNTL
ncbi:MAG: hypothetical protein COA33_005435 [Fluviicola sp.]|nr:hypothetical protein [Fluviicola sp.]